MNPTKPAMLTTITLATALGLGACSGTREVSHAGPHGGAVMTPEMQQSLTPDEALEDLREGNDRFVSGKNMQRDWRRQARDTASGQYPKAVVLTCLDSRVPPEIIFDQGIGDIFVGRVAGNFETPDLLGSMEFATELAGSKLIVVLGHSSCGAVKGAIDGVEMGHLTGTLRNITPAVAAAGTTDATPRSSDSRFVDRVVEANVRKTVRDIQDRSPIIDELVQRDQLRVVGAVYDLETGAVRWLD